MFLRTGRSHTNLCTHIMAQAYCMQHTPSVFFVIMPKPLRSRKQSVYDNGGAHPNEQPTGNGQHLSMPQAPPPVPLVSISDGVHHAEQRNDGRLCLVSYNEHRSLKRAASTPEAFREPQQLQSRQSNDTRAKCYVCEILTKYPKRLEDFGCYKGHPCPHVTCGNLECIHRLHSHWLDITEKKQVAKDLLEVDNSLPSHRPVAKDYNQDATRELTHATATSAASQGHAPGTPPAPLPEHPVEPPGSAQGTTRFTTRIVEIAAGVDDEQVPQSPDWYKAAHNAFPDVIPPNQRPISVKMSAALNLLDTLYSRDSQYLIDCMTKPINKRTEYIHAKARDRNAARKRGRSDGSYGYTEDEWIRWYEHNPLVGADITELVNQWEKDFFENPETTGGMKSETKQKIIQLERDGSRRSKKKAKQLRRGAFKAHLAQECIHQRQLAMMFLIYPVSACDQILTCWANYMTDDKYKREVYRSKMGHTAMVIPC